ncbi:MAG: hypothetical protein QOF02_100, partial [Blastocatellia bacterium]|nr:hypothetical protein [Blastocatellia bacterium]
MRHTVSLRRLSLCGLFVLLLAASASAQFRASVQGTVTDPAGAVVPGATVTLTNNETAKTQQTTTSDNGFYRISGLPPGKYTISVEQSGFGKKTLENVTVNAEETQGVDVALETGAVNASVTVSDQLPQLETENANVGRAITNQEVRRLPQVGRDPYELLRLTPGVFGDGSRSNNGLSVGIPNVTGPGGSNFSVFQVENQVPVTANGQRVSANNFMVDGVSVNSLGQGGAAIVTPNQESVKEVRVKSTSYSAEDGRNSGAQVEVVSQSGSNEFHGSALFKYNDPKLNAFNKYGGPSGPPLRVNQKFRQFGGSLGGPIIKNKLFFFFSTESLRNRNTDTVNSFVETAQYRQAVISQRPNSVTARVFQAAGIEPRIISALTVPCSAIGLNNPAQCQQVAGGLDLGSITGTLGNYTSTTGGGLDGIPDVQFAQLALPNQIRGDQYNTRIDYNRTNDTIALSTYFTRRDDLRSDSGSRSRPNGDIRTNPLNSSATLIWNHIFSPSMLNEARFNFSRFSFDEVESSVDTNFGIPRIEVEGYPTDRIRFGAPQGEATPGVFTQNTYEFSDVISKVIGNQSLRIGGVVRREQDNNNLVGGARPVYSFVGLFNLANDAPVFEGINADPRTGATADIQRYFRTNYYAAFIQDDWKFRPNLTFNLGLRYEFYSPLKEKEGRLSNLTLGGPGQELSGAT